MFSAIKITLIIMTLAVCLIVNCSEGPTDSPPVIEPNGYKVYFYDNGDNPKWYVYYPDENILDSAYLPISGGYTAAISPDGDRMYVDRGTGCEVVVVDVNEKTRLPDLTGMCGGVHVSFSPDNSRIITMANQLNILGYENHEILVVDSTPTLMAAQF